MDERTTGIILRTRPLTETSLIVHWLTADLGRVATVAKGARRPKSPFRGKLDVFYCADLSIRRSRHSELHLLREVGLRDTHPALRQDLHRLRQAAYAVALIEQTTETDTPLPGLYELFHQLVAHLSQQPVSVGTVFAFEMKLLDELGLAPEWPAATLNPASREVLRQLAAGDWSSLGSLPLSDAQARDIKHFLDGFLMFHLGRVPRGRSGALETPVVGKNSIALTRG